MKKWFIILVALAAIAVLVACEPETIEVTKLVEVEKEVVVTQVVEVAGEEKIVEVTKIVVEKEEVIVEVTPEPEVEGPKVGGEGEVYRIAALSDVTTRNIWAAYDPDASVWNYMVIGSYYPALFGYSAQRFDFVPALAADFATDLEQEGDFWVSTVSLKEGVQWSDGTDVTADDYAWTANTVLKFDLSGNWEAYDGNFLDRAEAIDATTVKLYYGTKPGLARHQFGTLTGPILNKAYWEPLIADQMAQMDEIAGLDPASEEYIAKREEIVQSLYLIEPEGEPIAGGLMWSQWEPAAYVENVRNDNYAFKGETLTNYANGAYKESWGEYEFTAYGDASGDVELEIVDGPFFERVLYSIYNQDAALLALTAGEVDYVMTPNGLSQGQVDQLSTNPGISIAENPQNGFRYLAFNFLRPPLDDVAVRQAVNCMIDKDFLTQSLLQGQVIAVYTPVPAGNGFWYNPDVTIFCDGMSAQDRLNESVRILKDAGYTWDVEPAWNEARGGSVDWGEGIKLPDGSYFPEMTLLAPSAGYDPLRATAGVYIEQWMQQLGMPISAELTNFNNILDAVYTTGEWDIFILGWGLSLYPDYVCDFFYTGSGFNTPNYSNPDFDAKCDVFYGETDLDKAREQNFELQDILAQDLPYIYLFTTPIRDAWNNESLIFPFSEVLDGIQGYYGMQSTVQAVQ